jgi:hypothetical protein
VDGNTYRLLLAALFMAPLFPIFMLTLGGAVENYETSGTLLGGMYFATLYE